MYYTTSNKEVVVYSTVSIEFVQMMKRLGYKVKYLF